MMTDNASSLLYMHMCTLAICVRRVAHHHGQLLYDTVLGERQELLSTGVVRIYSIASPPPRNLRWLMRRMHVLRPPPHACVAWSRACLHAACMGFGACSVLHSQLAAANAALQVGRK